MTDCVEEMVFALTGDPNAGFSGKSKNIDEKDDGFLTSVSRQLHVKRLALTSRQLAVLEQILEKHRGYLEEFGFNYELAISHAKLGIREVNRARWVKLVEADGKHYVQVRFLFNRRLVKMIEDLKNLDGHRYDADTKVHQFPATERNIYLIVSLLKDKNFEIDPEIIKVYEEVVKYEADPEAYLPSICDGEIRNLHPDAVKILESKFGKPVGENLLHYTDRSQLFGLLPIPVSEKVRLFKDIDPIAVALATRLFETVLTNSDEFTQKEIYDSLLVLKRYPLLILLDEDKAFQQLKDSVSELPESIDASEIAVLYRMDNRGVGKEYNDFVKSRKMNNPVDQNTKVVYILKNKLPKPLMKAGWVPEAAVLLSSTRCSAKVEGFMSGVDLVIHYDTDVTQWRRQKEVTEKLKREHAYM